MRFVDLADRFESSNDTVEEIRKRVADIPGAKITIALEADGPPTGAPVNIEIAGENFAVRGTISKEIKKALMQMPHVKDVRDNFVEGTPSVRVRVDRQTADVLRQLMITVPDGSSVPLSTLASVDITGSMGSITRINNQRVVTVKANVDETVVGQTR